MKSLTKRGVMEVQFNWIFILIAGGLILFFFMTVISYQQQLSRSKLGVELASQMELIFSGRGVSPGAKQPIAIADVPIQFDCTEYRIMDRRIASGNVLIFAPAEILTRTLLTITMSFDVPFRTSTMIMMTAPQIKYYFVGFGQDMKEKIRNALDFPFAEEGQKIDYEFASREMKSEMPEKEGQLIAYENNPFVRFVFDLQEGMNEQSIVQIVLPESFAEVADEKISAVAVQANRVEEETSLVFFYKKDRERFIFEPGVSQSPRTFGFASFIGAVFVKDGATYSCLMNRALRRTQNVIGVYKERYEQFLEEYNERTSIVVEQCRTVAREGVALLDGLAQGIQLREGTIVIDLNQFNQQVAALRQMNDEAVKSTCPAIY